MIYALRNDISRLHHHVMLQTRLLYRSLIGSEVATTGRSRQDDKTRTASLTNSQHTMATRKVSARGRSMAPPPAPSTSNSRQRAASGKSLAPSRSLRTTPVEELCPSEVSGSMAASSLPSRAKPTQVPSSSTESSIQVYIRCRRRSEREIQESSPIIISTEGPRGQNITIETAATTSVLGVVTLPPTRTYPFDTTFGPEADQSMVYQDVVHPMLDEVIKGYNCTLFAYGQTGTGKT